MPTEFARPDLDEILDRVQSDVESEIAGVTARLRHTPERAEADAVAGVAHTLHGHLAWIAEQAIVDRASERYVARWGNVFGVPRKLATPATRFITVTGTGGDMLSGREWVRAADGFRFTTVDLVEDITSEPAEIEAVEGGVSGNMAVGQQLQLVQPLVGVDSIGTIVAGGVDGTDLESIPDWVDRILERMQRPPMGGAPGDYVSWALEFPGITRAWEFRGTDGIGNPGLGKVAVTFVMDDRDFIIPLPDDVQALQDYLDERSPAEVTVFAPTPVEYDYTLIISPDTSAVQAAAIAEVDDMLKREAMPGGVVYLSLFNEAVSSAAGETHHTTISPTTDIVLAFGEIAVPGTATFE